MEAALAGDVSSRRRVDDDDDESRDRAVVRGRGGTSSQGGAPRRASRVPRATDVDGADDDDTGRPRRRWTPTSAPHLGRAGRPADRPAGDAPTRPRVLTEPAVPAGTLIDAEVRCLRDPDRAAPRPPRRRRRTLPATMWTSPRPRWIGCSASPSSSAAIFAWLGHWQLERSVESAAGRQPRDRDQQGALVESPTPQTPFPDTLGGQRVSVTGQFAADDFRVVERPRQRAATTGYWLVGRFVDAATAPRSPSRSAGARRPRGRRGRRAVRAAGADRRRVAGRYLPSEAPTDGDFESGRRPSSRSPQLINEWTGFDGHVYGGYVVADRGWGGLTAIYSPAAHRRRPAQLAQRLLRDRVGRLRRLRRSSSGSGSCATRSSARPRRPSEADAEARQRPRLTRARSTGSRLAPTDAPSGLE